MATTTTTPAALTTDFESVEATRAAPASSGAPFGPCVSRRERVAMVVALAAIVLAYVWSGHYWVDAVDEGYFLDLSQRVLHGALPYRDFSTYYTPGIFYAFAALFKVFGTNLLVIRYAMAVVRGTCALVLYVLTRRVAPWPLACLPFGIVFLLDAWPILPEPHPSWPSMLACLAAMECIARHQSGGRLRWLVGAGIATGIAYLFKQNIGAFTALGVAGYVMLRPRGETNWLVRTSQVVYAVATVALVSWLMYQAMDPLAAGALWLPLALVLGILTYRALTDTCAARHASPTLEVVREALAAGVPYVLVTAAWLVPLIVSLGSRQTPLGLFVGEINEASIATPYSAFTAGIPVVLLIAIWVSALLVGRRKAIGAAIVLSVSVLIVPTWQGARIPLTNDSGLAPIVGGLDDAAGSLSLYLPSLAVLAGIGALFLRGGRRGPLPWFVLFGALTSLTMYPRADLLHAIVSSPAALVAGAAALALVWTNTVDRGRWRQVGIMAALLLVPLAAVVPQVAWRVAAIVTPDDPPTRLQYEPLGLARASVLVPKNMAEDMRGAVEYVEAGTPPGQPLFVYPVAPLVNFLADRPNPTPFDHFIPGTLSPADFDTAVADLRTARPRYVVWDHIGTLMWGTDPDNRPISDYVWQCYHEVAAYHSLLVLERNGQPTNGC